MPAIRKFVVSPNLPEPLQPLLDIARNLWWTWNVEAITLLRRVDPDLWDKHGGNPIAVLGALPAERIHELEKDQAFLSHLERVRTDLERYLAMPNWFTAEHGEMVGRRIAYFSFEFGLHESLPLYSGGLGILAGDHLKSASDLGLPLVGVGLAYQFGYFRQYLNHDGWQMEQYPENDFYNMSMSLERDPAGKPVTIAVHYPGRTVVARIWRVQVGRNPLLLLDTNLPENALEDRELTSKLYSGDEEMRIRQEILLGIGGLRALITLGLEPDICHLNEGHSAFLALERLNLLMKEQGLDYDTAFELVRATNVFTTHTPVPAGNDRFPPELVEKYLKDKADELGLSLDDLLGLGREDPTDKRESFCMTVLALRLSRFANGVSELHGHVSRAMWQKVWPDVPKNEIPIAYVTNGIHTRSWLCTEIARLYERYLGPRWYEEPTNRSLWDRVDLIPDAELWRSHERMRERLVGFVRRRLRKQLDSRGANRARVRRASQVLDPEALTIGFARRFATYKRANLILSDIARLSAILNDPDRPVQIIFAGKAHPQDRPGKDLIREIVHLSNHEDFRNRIVFVENYNIEVARYMVQGVDIWLNTPRRPLEASGTSGMKVPPNGGMNLSVLDGWWCEGYERGNGWAIGAGEDYAAENEEYQDDVESTAIYDLLEKEIVPTFYERSNDDVPREWTRVMKNSMRTANAEFNTNRMVEEYTKRFYVPCLENRQRLTGDDHARAHELAEWRNRVGGLWSGVLIRCVEEAPDEAQPMGTTLNVRALVDLNGLPAEEVLVEAFHGALDPTGYIVEGDTTPLFPEETGDDGVVFSGTIPCVRAGRRGFTVRAVPRKNGYPLDRFETGLVSWWDNPAGVICDDTRKVSPTRARD